MSSTISFAKPAAVVSASYSTSTPRYPPRNLPQRRPLLAQRGISRLSCQWNQRSRPPTGRDSPNHDRQLISAERSLIRRRGPQLRCNRPASTQPQPATRGRHHAHSRSATASPHTTQPRSTVLDTQSPQLLARRPPRAITSPQRSPPSAPSSTASKRFSKPAQSFRSSPLDRPRLHPQQ